MGRTTWALPELMGLRRESKGSSRRRGLAGEALGVKASFVCQYQQITSQDGRIYLEFSALEQPPIRRDMLTLGQKHHLARDQFLGEEALFFSLVQHSDV